MGTFVYQGAGIIAQAHAESGFGLNLDLLETNIINISILIVLLVVYGGKFVGNILNERRSKIEQEITEAEKRAKEAAAALADAQTKLAQAQAEAHKILATAEQTAAKSRVEILTASEAEIERIKASANAEVETETAKVVSELKQRIAGLALAQVESQLKGRLDGSAQEKLIDRCLAQL